MLTFNLRVCLPTALALAIIGLITFVGGNQDGTFSFGLFGYYSLQLCLILTVMLTALLIFAVVYIRRAKSNLCEFLSARGKWTMVRGTLLGKICLGLIIATMAINFIMIFFSYNLFTLLGDATLVLFEALNFISTALICLALLCAVLLPNIKYAVLIAALAPYAGMILTFSHWPMPQGFGISQAIVPLSTYLAALVLLAVWGTVSLILKRPTRTPLAKV